MLAWLASQGVQPIREADTERDQSEETPPPSARDAKRAEAIAYVAALAEALDTLIAATLALAHTRQALGSLNPSDPSWLALHDDASRALTALRGSLTRRMVDATPR